MTLSPSIFIALSILAYFGYIAFGVIVIFLMAIQFDCFSSYKGRYQETIKSRINKAILFALSACGNIINYFITFNTSRKVLETCLKVVLWPIAIIVFLIFTVLHAYTHVAYKLGKKKAVHAPNNTSL